MGVSCGYRLVRGTLISRARKLQAAGELRTHGKIASEWVVIRRVKVH